MITLVGLIEELQEDCYDALAAHLVWWSMATATFCAGTFGAAVIDVLYQGQIPY